MKKIEAIVRHFKLEDVKNALTDFLYEQGKKGAKVFVVNSDKTQEVILPPQEKGNAGAKTEQAYNVAIGGLTEAEAALVLERLPKILKGLGK